MKKSTLKLMLSLIILIIAFVIAWNYGILDRLQDIEKMQNFIKSFGIYSYIAFILIYIITCIFMLPASVLTIVAGAVFGPIVGGILSLIGATLGATTSFVIAKYIAFDMVKEKLGDNKIYRRIDKGITSNGVSFLILTRLVPIFPFSLQNYAYGLTSISLKIYVTVSLICMAPGALIYSYMSGDIIANGISMNTALKFLIAGIILFLISLIPKYIAKKKNIVIDR
ncbi:TVP38/TMEM64 family protein [Clostridiaceae bacterium M8S5]|nr:TVP38/TMEM64 family protein [Clostridiaceae bacterium M8S5]